MYIHGHIDDFSPTAERLDPRCLWGLAKSRKCSLKHNKNVKIIRREFSTVVDSPLCTYCKITVERSVYCTNWRVFASRGENSEKNN